MLALVLVVGIATTAGAHTGSAGLVHRNHSNPVSAVTSLVGSVAGSVLGITNNNTGATNGSATAITATNNNATSPTVRATNAAGGTALDLVTTCRIGPSCFKAPPMTVNSDTKVANLNADKIDGLDASELRPLFARFRANLTLVASRGLRQSGTLAVKYVGSGHYGVYFERPVHNCAVVATSNGGVELGTTISTKSTPDDPNTGGTDESTLVEIQIGGPNGGLDRDFSVTVIC